MGCFAQSKETEPLRDSGSIQSILGGLDAWGGCRESGRLKEGKATNDFTVVLDTDPFQ